MNDPWMTYFASLAEHLAHLIFKAIIEELVGFDLDTSCLKGQDVTTLWHGCSAEQTNIHFDRLHVCNSDLGRYLHCTPLPPAALTYSPTHSQLLSWICHPVIIKGKLVRRNDMWGSWLASQQMLKALKLQYLCAAANFPCQLATSRVHNIDTRDPHCKNASRNSIRSYTKGVYVHNPAPPYRTSHHILHFYYWQPSKATATE